MATSKAARFKTKIEGYVDRYGSDVTRTRGEYRSGSTTVPESVATYPAIVNFEDVRPIWVMHSVGMNNMAEPGMHKLLFKASADIREDDTLTFEGYDYKVTELDTFTMSNLTIYQQARVVRSRPNA